MASTEYPLGPHRQVWASPDRSFGDPCLRDYGLRTEQVWRMWQAGWKPEEIADSHEVPEAAVLDAIEYESIHEGFAPPAAGMGVLQVGYLAERHPDCFAEVEE